MTASTRLSQVRQSPPRRITCRYLDRYDNRCTAEAVDPDGEILLCEHHLARALELLRRRIAAHN